jgi:pimeloyl-ACP methyl ester carboxylesterase
MSLITQRHLAAALVLLAAVGLSGCTTPIGAKQTSPRAAYRQVSASALDGELSDTALTVLHRYDLTLKFDKDPAAVLEQLHDQACSDRRRDLLFAIAELSLYHGEELLGSYGSRNREDARDWFLNSAIYAWFFLFSQAAEPPCEPFDLRYRQACTIYNRAVARAFILHADGRMLVPLKPVTRLIGARRVEVHAELADFEWKLEDMKELLPADDLLVHGLTVRERASGLGAPLVAVRRGTRETDDRPLNLGATLVLRAPTEPQAWCGSDLVVTLELHSGYSTNRLAVNGQSVPLERDFTAPLAVGLNDSRLWKLGAQQFFSSLERVPSGIYPTQPFAADKIPVIFVHGTFSSPVWWAEMWNTLHADPRLSAKYQFWNFIYNSGNPISLSAAKLREELQEDIHRLDPAGTNPVLRRAVVIGHSQGGLLTKLTAVDSGDAFWRNVFPTNYENTPFKTEADRQYFRRLLWFEHAPEVERVVFISTPHRGSFLATSFVRKLARRFMSLPTDLLGASERLLTLQGDTNPSRARKLLPTSLDSMSPKNKGLLTLAALPVAPGIKSHSIIAVKGDGPIESGSDGVVKYSSAHIEGVESEFVVRSGHSCQDKPAVIEEVRRILLKHLEENP